MPELVLSGPLGVGKTTARRALVEEHGFWSPPDVTTRPVGHGESDKIGYTESEFQKAVISGRLAVPVFFGGYWYAWRTDDLQRLMNGGDSTVIDVRPQTALMLSTLRQNVIAVWLWIDDHTLSERRKQQDCTRGNLGNGRLIADQEDARFEALFRHRLAADISLIANLLKLAR